MNLHLEKARKLIDDLEARLQATSSHTSNAREVLHRWLQTGEGQMRKKSASALKQVRRRADGFTKALTKLEESLSRSLGKLAEKIEKPTKEKAKEKAKAEKPLKKSKSESARTRKKAKKVMPAPTLMPPLAPGPSVTTVTNPPATIPSTKVLRKPLNLAAKAQNRRIQAHASGRGRRRQGKRDHTSQ